MSTFAPQTVQQVVPDPFKHVNYIQGMVLGVNDFNQEFAYLAGRDQSIARDLLGYGTVCGLRVFARPAGDQGWEIVVEAGTAVNPRGEWIRVPAAQCARLRNWIDAHPADIRRYAGSPPEDLRVYVVLCYRDCKVDLVPIPGEPCRSEDDSFQPSRLQDDYTLELWFEPPQQTQEDAIRDFARWLSRIEIEDFPDSEINREAFLAAVRDAVPQYESPPLSSPMAPPDYMLGSPPVDLRIPRAAVYEYLRLAFRIWVTELRPLWLGKNQTCAGLPPAERCVLLAEVAIPLTDEGLLSDVEDVTVNEEQRPYLLSLRMVQEWLMRRPPSAAPITLGGDATGDPGANIVAGIHGLPVVTPDPATQTGNLLAFNGADWQLVSPPAVPPALVLGGDATGDPTDNRVTRLHGRSIATPTPGADDGRLLSFDGASWTLVPPPAVPPALVLGGDATGDPADNRVTRLHGQQIVAPNAANAGHLLSYTGAAWQLVPPPAAPAGSPIVAAGRFDASGGTLFNFNKLAARRIDFLGATFYFLTFSGIVGGGSYVVKGTIVNSLRGEPRFIEVIELREDPLLGELRPLVEEFNRRRPEFPIDLEVDIVVRVLKEVGDADVRGFMIEISQF